MSAIHHQYAMTVNSLLTLRRVSECRIGTLILNDYKQHFNPTIGCPTVELRHKYSVTINIIFTRHIDFATK